MSEEQFVYPVPEASDLSRWRLKTDLVGRHTWHYLATDDDPEGESNVKDWPQDNATKFHLNILKPADLPFDVPTEKATTPEESARRGMEFVRAVQCPTSGHWAGDYGGPMFLIPGLVISLYVAGTLEQAMPRVYRQEMIRYLLNLQHPEQGGWGLHIEDKSTMFGTALNYVVLRILGVPRNCVQLARAREFMAKHDGAYTVPAWGKFWLALMNVYSWEGLNPVQPELWLLPYALPIHPGRYWCHTRMVYLPMSYCYAHRITVPINQFIRSLREELYPGTPFAKVDWMAARNAVAAPDNYSPHTQVLDSAYVVLGGVEACMPPFLRARAVEEVAMLVRAEDDNTRGIGIGPVSKVINMVVAWHREGADSEWYQMHMDRVPDYLWMGADGLRMTGTNGSQLWDAAFYVQAMISCGAEAMALDPTNREAESVRASMNAALRFLDQTIVRRDVPNHARVYREPSVGGYPFSTNHCGWTVADCTAEGLRAAMSLQSQRFAPRGIFRHRDHQASMDLLLAQQNPDGGFSSYEPRRGPTILEAINPAEVFSDIMVEYSYVELTSACSQAMVEFRHHYPEYRPQDIGKALERCYQFILSSQKPDGSWYGSWGVCFTYGGWFGLEGLATFQQFYSNSEASRRGCDFLLAHQNADGGWAESYLSSSEKVYHGLERSTAVHTAWVVMGLLAARCPNTDAIKRAVKLIMERQLPEGNWPQESIVGNFNKNCMISYPNYTDAFSLWALGRFNRISKHDFDYEAEFQNRIRSNTAPAGDP